MKQFDVVIIGAGPSGLMSAITLAQKGKSVCLIDKNTKVGKKLMLTGGGRCNITNAGEIQKHIIRNPKFLYSSLAAFGPNDIIKWFENAGVPLKVEDHGRVFPQSDRAQSIRDVLASLLDQYHVHQYFERTVKIINFSEKIVQTENEIFHYEDLIIATGGITYPATGSSGDGLSFAKQLGHSIIDPIPAESPLLSNDLVITSKQLQGLTFPDCIVSFKIGKKEIINRHSLLFTHFGLSGPAALRMSFHIEEFLQTNDSASIALNFLPGETVDSLCASFLHFQKTHPKKHIRSWIETLTQKRFAEYIIQSGNITTSCADTPHKSRDFIIQSLTNFPINIIGTKGFEAAFVTAGGVNIKEINPKTMCSKLNEHVYFTGEILDVHGHTGGYNLTIAFSTGMCAAQAILQKAITV